MFGKLLTLMLAGKDPSMSIMFRQILLGLAGLVVMSIVLGLLAGAFLISAIYLSYHALLINGLHPLVAQATIGTLVLLMIGLIYGRLQMRITRLQRNITQLIKQQSPISSKLHDFTTSFMDGLMDSTTAPKG